jgi:phosphatidylserine decarboxylase
MITAKSWQVGRRYVLPVLALGLILFARWRRAAFIVFASGGAVLLFFRDPHRPLEPDDDVVYAPADGIVTAVEEAPSPHLDGVRALRVSTFLSIHNVHVNRSPVAGTVTSIREIGGRFVPAFLSKSSESNRQNRTVIQGTRGTTVLVQVAGIVARRITRWISVGDELAAGQRVGLIHFGSRVDVIVPSDVHVPLVRRGDRVRAGMTPVARYVHP